MISKEYIAGFFDGEGCISMNFSVERPTKIRPKGRTRHALQTSITNTSKDILVLIHSMYGGKVYRHSSGCWVWKICHRDLQKNFLNDVMPYLMLKNLQAKIALRYLDTVLENGNGYNPIGESTKEIRKECFIGLKEDKRRFSTKGSFL